MEPEAKGVGVPCWEVISMDGCPRWAASNSSGVSLRVDSDLV